MFDLFVVYMQELFEYLWRKQISLSMDRGLFLCEVTLKSPKQFKIMAPNDILYLQRG